MFSVSEKEYNLYDSGQMPSQKSTVEVADKIDFPSKPMLLATM